MDRAIKFRAWDYRNKRMISWGELLNSKELLQSFFGNEHYVTNPPRYFYERMQFTGLYDCEGKEIYEKDIVEVELFGIIKQYVVLWRNDFFCWAYLSLEYAKETLEGWGDAFESQLTYQHKPKLLGNIYEHPNLLQ